MNEKPYKSNLNHQGNMKNLEGFLTNNKLLFSSRDEFLISFSICIALDLRLLVRLKR